MKDNELAALMIGLVLGLVVGLLGGGLIRSSMWRDAAIKNGSAYYDPQTANFTWVVNTNQPKVKY